MTVVTAK